MAVAAGDVLGGQLRVASDPYGPGERTRGRRAGRVHEHLLKVPASAWTPAVETDGEARDGAWVAELTGKLLDGRLKGVRLIIRKERPYPGAQLRFTDADGMRITCFATNTPDR